MPKEKENEKEEVKADNSEKKPEEKPKKRKNSLTDESSTSSSNCSLSSGSSNTDSDESIVSEKEKGTMTSEDILGEGALEEEEQPTQFAGKKLPLKLISQSSPVSISADSHFLPINPATTSDGKNGKKKNKQKAKQLTKKEKRERDTLTASLIVDSIARRGNSVEMNDLSFLTEGVRSGEMLVKAKNDAARRAINNQDQVNMPFYDNTRPNGNFLEQRTLNQSSIMFPSHNDVSTVVTSPEKAKINMQIDALNHDRHQKPIHIVQNKSVRFNFRDCHEIAQMDFWNTQMKVGEYTNLPPLRKLKIRMGFGVAACGFYDDEPLTLSTFKTTYASRSTYTEVASEFRENWREKFAEGLEREKSSPMSNKTIGVINNVVETVWELCHRETDPWMRKLLELVLQGKTIKAWNRIRKVAGVLRKRAPYNTMRAESLYTLIIERVMTLLTCKTKNMNVVMFLAAHQQNEKRCFNTGHKFCMMLDSLLAGLPEFARKNYLSMATIEDEMTALHLTAMSGYPCQMNILLKYKANVDVKCNLSRTPLYYAARRSYDLLTRQLLWSGADIGSLTKYTTLESDYFGTKFAGRRVEALEAVMNSWLSTCLMGFFDPSKDVRHRRIMKITDSLTELHTISLDPNIEDGPLVNYTVMHRSLKVKVKREVFAKLKELTNKGNQFSNNDNLRMVLALLPAMYTKRDSIMPAEFPHITRVPLIEYPRGTALTMLERKDEIRELRDRPEQQVEAITKNMENVQTFGLIRNASLEVNGVRHPLESALKSEHNGTVYLYTLPDALTDFAQSSAIELKYEEVYCKHMLDIKGSFFMVQAFLLQNRDLPSILDSNDYKKFN